MVFTHFNRMDGTIIRDPKADWNILQMLSIHSRPNREAEVPIIFPVIQYLAILTSLAVVSKLFHCACPEFMAVSLLS